MKCLLEHAYNKVPYYTKLFDQCGFNPRQMNSFDGVRKIPFLDKRTVRENTDSLIAKDTDRKRLAKAMTGGSTGEPLVLYLCNKRRAADMAAGLRIQNSWGVDVGDKRARLLGVPFRMRLKDRINILLSNLMNLEVFSPFSMNKRNMSRYISTIQRTKPRMIFGYTSAVYLLARFIKKENICLGKTHFKVIATTGEPLFDFQKRVIAGIFNCPVSNDYGVMEGGCVAMECREGKLHILSDNVFFENIKDGRDAQPGEEGEVVVTNLYNYGMPFIRYKLGDTAVVLQERCACGREYPIIRNLIGRQTDFIVLPGGGLIHGAAFIIILSGYRGIELFKVIQREVDTLIIMIQKSNLFSSGTIDIIKKRIDNLCEQKMKLDFIISDNIESMYKGAKYKYIISEIAGPHIQQRM